MKNKRKNSNYKAQFEPMTPQAPKKSRFMLIFVCIFVAAVILAGAILGIALGVKNSRAVVKYKGLTVNKEEASFFAANYKRIYMENLSAGGVNVSDTAEFWNTECNGVNTYGEFLEYYTKQYIKEILVANYLYDSYTKLTSQDKRDIKLAAEEILDYQAGGSVETFNENAEKMGFDYSVFKDVTEMLYKANMVRTVIFGKQGANLVGETEILEEYLKGYSHVKLIFIREDRDFKLDEDGNRVQDKDGDDLLFYLSEEERIRRQADIASLSSAMEGLESGGEIQISPTMFENYLARYKSGYDDLDKNGYYFHEASSYTAEFAIAFPDVVETALDMQVGQYKKVKFDLGYCFIYKYDVTPGAYLEKTEVSCFDDFYNNAAASSFDKMIEELTKDIKFNDKISEINFLTIPKNTSYYPKF